MAPASRALQSALAALALLMNRSVSGTSGCPRLSLSLILSAGSTYCGAGPRTTCTKASGRSSFAKAART
jgi:hypothetical protein